MFKRLLFFSLLWLLICHLCFGQDHLAPVSQMNESQAEITKQELINGFSHHLDTLEGIEKNLPRIMYVFQIL